jgi:ADP-heptose:LPS heptosyltransferase
MHILNLSGRVELGPDNVVEPGTYLAENLMAAQLLVMGGGGEMEPLKEKRRPQFDGDFGGALYVLPQKGTETGGTWCGTPQPCTSILIGRTGGLGDLILLTPVLREIKRRWPTVKLAVACIRELGQGLENLPFVDEILPYPVSQEKANTYDGWLWLENAVEKGEDSRNLHSVDCVAKFIGLDLPEGTDKRQAYVVSPMERADILEVYPRIPGVRRLCIQPKASAACRTYNKTGQVVAEFLKKGWEVFLLGNAGEFKTEPKPGLRTITDGWTFRHRAAIVETADCLLAPDSSLLHVAGALGVPAVGLYGVFPWQLRTLYAPTTRALTGSGFSCNPCHFHATPRQAFPSDCPTKDKGFCGVMDAIEVNKIVKTVEEIARKAEAGNMVAFAK